MDNSQLLPPEHSRPVRLGSVGHDGGIARIEVLNDPSQQGEASFDSRALQEYWQMLMRRKGIILLAALLCGLVGYSLGIMQTPLYVASTTIELQEIDENFLDIRGVNATGGGGEVSSHRMTQVEILKSNTLIDRVVDRLQLDKRPEFQPFVELPDAETAEASEVLVLPPPTAKEIARNSTRGALTIFPSDNSSIIQLVFEWTEPVFASEFLNALAEEYKLYAMEARWKATQETSDWLEKQIGDLKEKLQQSEAELQSYASAHGLMFTGPLIGERSSVAEDKLRQLQGALSSAQTERVAKQSQYETAIESPIETLPDVLNDGSLRQYQEQLTGLRRELAQLQTAFKPTYPKVGQLQAQVTELEKTLAAEREKVIERIRNEYETARKQERLLSADYANQTKLVSAQAGKDIHYKILMQGVESNRKLYDSMLSKLKEAGIASAMRASNVRVVDPAEPPRRPSSPNPRLNATLGTFAGLFLGVIFALVRDNADRSLRQPGDVSRWLRLPELGVIPLRDALPDTVASNSMLGSFKLPSLGSGRNGNILATNGNYRREWSPLAEYFRVTLTSILFARMDGRQPKLMVVTSPGPGEGKSSVASNLAISLADIGKRVLIVDADMRKPRLHEIFNIPNTWGLSDLLQEKTPLDRCPLEAIARSTQIPGLYVLPSGPGTKTIGRLLYSNIGRQLLQRLREEFDVVLIDTPPVLQISDARIIARMTDGVVLVLRASKTTRDSGKAAKERLEADGIPILGTILNAWNPRSHGYGGYYDYGSYGQYYHEVSEGRKQA